MTEGEQTTITRDWIYRYILDCLGEKKTTSLPWDLAVLKFYPLFCSPKVSKAITSYIDAKFGPSAQCSKQTAELISGGDGFAKFIALVATFVEQNIKYHRDVPPAYEAIIEAMCWELEMSRDEFLGSSVKES